MKNAKNYFEKNGFIYGDYAILEYHTWRHKVIKFTSYEEALKWLHTESYDFAEREFVSKTTAKKLGYKEGVSLNIW